MLLSDGVFGRVVMQTPEWALNLDLLRRLEHAGAVERIRAYQELAVQRFLNHARPGFPVVRFDMMHARTHLLFALLQLLLVLNNERSKRSPFRLSAA